MEKIDRAHAGRELFYFARRARIEQQFAVAADDERALLAHRSLGLHYSLRAMRIAVSDARAPFAELG